MGQIANKMLFDAVSGLFGRAKDRREEKRNTVKTKRLVIRLSADFEAEELIAAEQDGGLRAAYGEMLEASRKNPEKREWYAVWFIELHDGTRVGDMCFKGLSDDGAAEIGYGLLPEYFGKGYATEAVKAMIAWAFSHKEVTRIEAETDPTNAASQRVLCKAGFAPTGENGEEGPRFAINKN